MRLKHRIERLEKRLPREMKKPFVVDLDFRVAGKPRSWVQQEAIRRLRVGIADPRATVEQRESWHVLIATIDRALRSQIAFERTSMQSEPLNESEMTP